MTLTQHEKDGIEEDLKFVIDIKRQMSDFQMFIMAYGLIKGVGENQLESLLEVEKTAELYYFDLKRKQREFTPIHKPDQSDSPPPR